jgi:two-component system, LytTR family, response regulator
MIHRRRPDLVFLDVQMPGLDGFGVLRALPAGEAPPLVIFATAFDAYALQAFEADAIGYLLKPVDRDKLALAVERAGRLLGNPKEASEQSKKLRSIAEAAPGVLSHVVARLRDRYVLLPLEDVCFFRMEDQLVKVKTAKTLFWTDYTLADLEKRLPDPTFFRAHRSAIVNLRMVAEAAPAKGGIVLTMKDEQRSEIQVSERQASTIRQLLQL